MKKLGIIILLSLVFLLGSCNNDNTIIKKPTTSTGIINDIYNKNKDNTSSGNIINGNNDNLNSTGITNIGSRMSEITFYLYYLTGSDMSGDISRYLVPVKTPNTLENLNQEEKINTALTSLFSLKTNKYKFGNNNLLNSLYDSNLEIKNINTSSGITTVSLSGNVIGHGVVMDAFPKLQISKTIENYIPNYKILLNNSEKEWRCLLDESGMCE